MTSPRQPPAVVVQQESGQTRNLCRPRALLAIVGAAALIAAGLTHFIATLAELGELGGDSFLIPRLLLAIGLIITVGSLGGWIATCCGQPRVVGEMVAGITLGPSLLGQFLPGVQRWLFPTELIPHLGFIAQPIIIVFVFLLGANLPLGLLRGSGRQVITVGVGMLAVPTLCGILLAGGLAGLYRPAGVALVPFVLFIGVSMGVTAFPVLVRILAEHDLVGSGIGTLGLTAAGIGDAIAWCLLVLVVALHGGAAAAVLPTATLLVVFAVLVWIAYRPVLHHFMAFAEKNSRARACSSPVLLLSAVSGAYEQNRRDESDRQVDKTALAGVRGARRHDELPWADRARGDHHGALIRDHRGESVRRVRGDDPGDDDDDRTVARVAETQQGGGPGTGLT